MSNLEPRICRGSNRYKSVLEQYNQGNCTDEATSLSADMADKHPPPFLAASQPLCVAVEPPTPRRSTAITVNRFANRGMIA